MVYLLPWRRLENIYLGTKRKVMKFIYALLFLMFLSLPIRLQAQVTESDKNQKTNKLLVSVPVSVSDREGHYISGLKKEDFKLYQTE